MKFQPAKGKWEGPRQEARVYGQWHRSGTITTCKSGKNPFHRQAGKPWGGHQGQDLGFQRKEKDEVWRVSPGIPFSDLPGTAHVQSKGTQGYRIGEGVRGQDNFLLFSALRYGRDSTRPPLQNSLDHLAPREVTPEGGTCPEAPCNLP